MNKIFSFSVIVFFVFILAMHYQPVDARQGICHAYGIGNTVLKDTCTDTDINCKDFGTGPNARLTVSAFINDKGGAEGDSSVKVLGECFDVNIGPGTGIMIDCIASSPSGEKDTCFTQRVGIEIDLKMQCTYELQGIDQNDLWHVSCGGLPQGI